MQAALDCADGGLETVIVEKSPSVGGMMARLDKTFPTIDCSICILGPKMVDVAQHEKITLHAYSEIEDIKGYVGNYQVKVRKKATYVDWTKCTGCGECMEKCPGKNAYDHFNFGVAPTKAINIPFPQAIPKKAKIDPQFCRQFIKGKCGVCAKVCPTKAINYEMQDEIVTEEVGAIVVASGYGLIDQELLPEYGGGRYPDVITGIQYERISTPRARHRATSRGLPTTRSRRPSSSSRAPAPATSPSAFPTAPTSAACTSPSRRSSRRTTSPTPSPTSSIWTSARPARATTSSPGGPRRSTA